MRAGPLTERVEVLVPVRATGAAGASATATRWESRGVFRAQLKSAVGRGSINAAEIFGAQQAAFNFRITVEIKEGWRLRHIGGLLYKVTAPPVKNRALAMQTITCERVND